MVVESRAAKGDKGLATIYTVSLSVTLRWQGPRVAVASEDDLRQAAASCTLWPLAKPLISDRGSIVFLRTFSAFATSAGLLVFVT